MSDTTTQTETKTEAQVEQVVKEEKPVEPRELSAYAKEYTKQYQMDWEYHHRAIISPLEVDELASKIASRFLSGMSKMISFLSKLNGIFMQPPFFL